MIRVILTNTKMAYGSDISYWEDRESDWVSNLLTEDLVERVHEGQVVMYFEDNESAENWFKDSEYDYELLEDDNN